MDNSAWQLCKREDLLTACDSHCLNQAEGIGTPWQTNLMGALCRVKHAKLTLLLLWGALALLFSALSTGFLILQYLRARRLYQCVNCGHMPNASVSNGRINNYVVKSQQGWTHALKWGPWGLKVAALIGLGMFWCDKASDISLLQEVWGHAWTGYVLLVLFLYQYAVLGYVFVYRLSLHLMGWTVWTKVILFTFVMALPAGVANVIVLDTVLFFSDLGFNIGYIDDHCSLQEYQLFRDVGRALCGTLPTVILQSVAFTLGADPNNGLALSTEVFVTSFVAAGLQLLKVSGEVMYIAYNGRENVFWVFWQLFAGSRVVKRSLSAIVREKNSSELLAGQQVGSSQQDVM